MGYKRAIKYLDISSHSSSRHTTLHIQLKIKNRHHIKSQNISLNQTYPYHFIKQDRPKPIAALSKMPVMKIVNNYPYPIYVFISKYTTPKGSDDWFYLPVGASETWIRQDGWEVVVAKNEDDTWRQGQYQRTDGADRELLDGGSSKLESSEGEVVDQSNWLEGLSIMSLPE